MSFSNGWDEKLLVFRGFSLLVPKNAETKSVGFEPICLLKRDKEGSWECSGRMLDSRPRGRGFEPHLRHCMVVFEQDTFILA